jgi:type III secretion protein C
MKINFLICAVKMGVAALMVAHAGAWAAIIPWKQQKFNYIAQNKPLKEFLTEFGASQNITVVAAGDINGTLNGKFNITPQNMLDLVSATFGVIWYYDGNILFVYPSSEAESQMLYAPNGGISQLRSNLQNLNLLDKRYPIVFNDEQSTALVSGPKRYVQLVQQALSAIDTQVAKQKEEVIQVFTLKHAWASDHSYSQGGKERTIPGVASILKSLYGSSRTKTAGLDTLKSPQMALLGNASVSRLDRLTSVLPEQERAKINSILPPGLLSGNAGSTQASKVDVATPRAADGSEGPQFEADSRINAVIVRDKPDQMMRHKAVIEALDVRQTMVEIEARIVEVSSDAVENLGLDWRLHAKHVDLQFGKGTLPTLSAETAMSNSAPLLTPGNGVNALQGGLATTLAGNSARYLIARINALTQEGKANTLLNPKILTLDNMEAIIENTQSFYVKVAGNQDTSLYQVSAGTTLRVTPLVVADSNEEQVKLAIRIEDGGVNTSVVDQLPTVNRRTINTESYIKMGESLLIAGYASESLTDDKVEVPFLSKLPLIGPLFTYQGKKKSRVERLFMLTPKIIRLWIHQSIISLCPCPLFCKA